MQKVTKIIFGCEMTEGQIAQAFYEHKNGIEWRDVKAVMSKLQEMEYANGMMRGARGPVSWRTSVAILNGKPHRAVHIGPYMIIEQNRVVRLGGAQKWGMFLARIFRATRIVSDQ